MNPIMKRYFIFIVLFSCSAYAQEIQEPKNWLRADGVEVTKHSWKASWIAHPTASAVDYGVFLFRKNFNFQWYRGISLCTCQPITVINYI